MESLLVNGNANAKEQKPKAKIAAGIKGPGPAPTETQRNVSILIVAEADLRDARGRSSPLLDRLSDSMPLSLSERQLNACQSVAAISG